MILLKNALITMVIKYLKYISNNDEKRDLHSRITKDCWQLNTKLKIL